MGKIDQETQIRNSDNYLDNITPGSGMESPASADQNIMFDLNALRSQVQKIIDPQQLSGTSKWYTSIATALHNFGLRQFHDKKLAFRAPLDTTRNIFQIGTVEIGSVDTVADVNKSLQNKYFIFYHSATQAYYVWYNVNAEGTDPAPTPPAGVSYTAVPVAIATNATAGTVATATQTAIGSSTAFVTCTLANTNELTITNRCPGPVTDVADGPGGSATAFTIATDQQGATGSAQGVLVSSAMVAGGAGVIAVGSSSATHNGYMAADETEFDTAGVLGVGTSTAVSTGNVVLNIVDLYNAWTNDPVLDGGVQVYALLQVLHGTSDGSSIAGEDSENLQLSFVKISPITDTYTLVTLTTGCYNFQLAYQQSFYDLDRGALLTGGQLPDILDPSSVVARLPFRHFDVTANAAAGETFNIQTGVFSGTGTSTIFSQYGTPILQSTANLFRDDNRTKIWRNGVLQSKGTGKDVSWVSTSQIAFAKIVKNNDEIIIESPASF